jgi:phage gp29-like protein
VARNTLRVRQTADGQQWISPNELSENIFGNREVPRTEWLLRRNFGAQLDPETIEQVLHMANHGHMRDLTDLQKETINFDPHLACEIGKRFRALASVEGKVVEASGEGVDPTKAARYADLMRQQIRQIKHWKQNIIRLDWGHCMGRAAMEKVWRQNTVADRSASTGKIEWKFSLAELNWIHARRQSFGPMREIRVRDDVWQGGMFEKRGLDIESIPHKFITFKPQLFDEYPEREGFGPRTLYFSFFKRFGWRERLILLEIFGKPWRIIEIDKDAPKLEPEELDDAEDRADELGGNASAALQRGMHLQLTQPDAKSTQHHDTIEDCNDEISKLVLGNTRTTSSKTSGQGSKAEEVHQDGETLVINADGWGVSDVITELFEDCVELNAGPDELINAPYYRLEYKAPPDPTQETTRTQVALGLGVPLKVDEVYETIGFSKPQPGDAVVTQQAPAPVPGATTGANGQPPAAPRTPGESRVSTIGDDAAPADATADPNAQKQGADPLVPLAQAASRSLRLSRLSSDFFSRRS